MSEKTLKMAEHRDGDSFDFLIGKRSTKVIDTGDAYLLTTADGEEITVTPNQGCGGCSSGWSEFSDLEKLAETDNAITNVTTEYGGDDDFKLFIYYHDKTLEVEGTDGYGNGYYGGGFWVTIEEVN